MADAKKEVAVEPKKELPEGYVSGRVTKMGHDKIHTGERVGFQSVKYKKDDILVMPRERAEVLEARGYFEIDE